MVNRRSTESIIVAGDDKPGYVFTEELLDLALFAKVFATGQMIPFLFGTVLLYSLQTEH